MGELIPQQVKQDISPHDFRLLGGGCRQLEVAAVAVVWVFPQGLDALSEDMEVGLVIERVDDVLRGEFQESLRG